MQRGGVRVTIGGVGVDVPLGVFSGALPVMTYNAVTGVFEGAAAGGGGAPSGPAGGDLGSTYPNPTVVQARGIRETAGPTNLVVGAIADQTLVRRAGATAIGTAFTVDGAGNIAAAGTYNGVAVAAHAARHNPGGADTVFPGTWVNHDHAKWSGTQWDPKFEQMLHLTADNAAITSATLVDVAALIFAIPRAGTYDFGWVLSTSQSVAQIIGWGANYSGTITNFQVMVTNPTNTTTVSFGTGAQNVAFGTAVARGVATDLPVYVQGRMVVSTTGNLSVKGQRATSGNLIVRSGSFGWVRQN